MSKNLFLLIFQSFLLTSQSCKKDCVELPDLSLKIVTSSAATIFLGDPFKLSVIYSNTSLVQGINECNEGGGAGKCTTRLLIEHSEDREYWSFDSETFWEEQPIKFGENRIHEYTHSLNRVGYYRLTYCVDYKGEIKEFLESNNSSNPTIVRCR